MIVPITISKNGEDQNIGTAQVEPVEGDFTVSFYLNPHYSLRDETRRELEMQLKDLARQKMNFSL